MYSNLIILGLIVIICVQNIPVHRDKIDSRYGWHDMSAFTHPYKDLCIGSGTGVDFEAKIEFIDPNEDTDFLGQWNDRTNTLVLKDTSLDTVAHEVNHLVKELVRELRIEDEHYEAYAQGYWTQCVWDIVQRKEVVDFINKVN